MTPLTVSQWIKWNNRYESALKYKGHIQEQGVIFISALLACEGWFFFTAIVNIDNWRGCLLWPTGFLKENVNFEKSKRNPLYLAFSKWIINLGSLMVGDKAETIFWANIDLMGLHCSKIGPWIACRVALAGGLKYDINVSVYFCIN